MLFCKKKGIYVLVVIVLLFTMMPFSANAATTTPTITTPSKYLEVPMWHMFTVVWDPPETGTVDHYLFSMRCIRADGFAADGLKYDRKNMGKSESITLSPDLFNRSLVYRIAVGAVMSNGSEKWAEQILYVGITNMQIERPISFKIWSGFSDATKNAIYYATRPWNNAVGTEVVNTYAFSNAFTQNQLINNDNINSVVKVVHPDQPKALMVATTRYNNDWDPVEVDITVNPDKAWANSAQSNKYDVQSVMTHEMGHAVGLSDKYDSFATNWTMYYQGKINDISMRTLDAYDIKQAKNLCNSIPV